MGRPRRWTKKQRTHDGVVFRSGFEKTLAQQIEEAGIGYEFETKTVLYVEPAKTKKYIPDFMLNNGIIIEAKGRWDLDDRKKIVMVREQNPGLDVRMVFQRDHPLNKGAKTKYSEWCEKRGIPYAIGRIPEKWLQKLNAKKA